MNILAGDGEDGAREGFNNTLYRKGYQAIFANSGEDALALFRISALDLVLTDIQLPTKGSLLNRHFDMFSQFLHISPYLSAIFDSNENNPGCTEIKSGREVTI